MSSSQNRVSGGIVGELILGEVPEWYAGVCKVEVKDDGSDTIVVRGENDHPVGEVDPNAKMRESVIDPESEVYNLEAVAEQVNRLIQKEHNRL